MSDEEIAALLAWNPRRHRRRVSLASMAPARDRSSISVSNLGGRWRVKLIPHLTQLRVVLTTVKNDRFATMAKFEAADVAARLSTHALLVELGKRLLRPSTGVLMDALIARHDPLGEALAEFSGRHAALRRGNQVTKQVKPGLESGRIGHSETSGAAASKAAHPDGEAVGASGDGAEATS